MTDLATAPAVITPHPVTLEDQRHETLNVGETVQQFLDRVIEEADREQLEVKLGGVVVPEPLWGRVRAKAGQLIEVRGAVNKQVLYIVAMAVLMYFTMGTGAAAGAGFLGGAGIAGVVGGVGGMLLASVAFAAGPACGGKVIK